MINNDKIELFNGIALLKDDQCICRFIRESGRLDHDTNMLPLLKKFIKNGDVVLDIGAFIGDHTIYYSELVGEDGMVFAYEPSKDAYTCLQYNKDLAKYKNIVLINKGIGKQQQITRGMVKVSTNNGMNYLSDLIGKRDEEIELDTIDNSLSLVNKIDFIKIDVEGYELDVLKGGKATINKFKPTMLIEINDHTLNRNNVKREEIFAWLEENNYNYRNIYENQGLEDSQLDIICLPK